jgi:hypothetical protein
MVVGAHVDEVIGYGRCGYNAASCGVAPELLTGLSAQSIEGGIL